MAPLFHNASATAAKASLPGSVVEWKKGVGSYGKERGRFL